MANLNTFDFPIRDFESKIKSSKTSFILDSRNFWHNGIHFSSNEEVKNVYDSEVVAMRLSKAYENTYTYDLLTAAYLNFFKRDALTDDTFETYFESQPDGYKLKSGLSDAEKEKAYKLVEELFSNSFVLMKHSVLNTKGKEIVFYSLAQHLKPIGRMTTMQKLKLYWFDCRFKKKSSFYYYVDVRNVSIETESKNRSIPNKIPCETAVLYGNDFNDASKAEIEIIWTENGTTYKGKIDKKFIRDTYKEIKRPARTDTEKQSSEYLSSDYSKKELNKIQIFTSERYSNRQTKAVIDSQECFRITEGEFTDKYPNTNILKVAYLDNNENKQTGYIYLEEASEADKKKWESIKTQITEKTEDKIEFSDIEIHIKLKEGISVDSVCVPKERGVPKGAGIGFAGFSVTKEEDEKTLENEDATAIHYEIFCENDDFMNFRRNKQLDLSEPAEYKVNGSFKCFKERPATKKEIKTDIELAGCYYVKKEETLRIIDDESFVKVKILADAKPADYYFLRDDFVNWIKTPCSVYTVKDKKCDTYKKAGNGKIEKIENGQVPLYAKYNYLYEQTEGAYRKVKYIYEPRSGSEYLWVRTSVFNDKFKIVNNKDEYVLEKTIPANEILEVYNELDKNEEEEISGGDITVHNTKVNRYEGVKTVQTWIKAKAGGKEYWIDEKNISAEKDYKPIEQISYNDWKRYFTEVKIKDIGEYKCGGQKEAIQKLGFTDTQFDLYNRRRHESDSYTIASLIKSDTRRTNMLYFKNKTEWIKNEALTKELYKGTPFEEKIKKLREKYVFWDEAQSLKTEGYPKSDTGCFFHAASFLKHLDKVATIPEFNPYEGATLSYYASSEDRRANKLTYFSVKDNPGFAPVYTWGSDVYESNNKHFASTTGLYNEDYSHLPSYSEYKEFYHEGVDFRGNVGTEIISLIHSKVIAYGWQIKETKKGVDHYSAYGKCVWLYNLYDKGVYLLAHLSKFAADIEVGKEYKPGDVIAYVGTSGAWKDTGMKEENRWDSHLHLSYYDFEFLKNKDTLVIRSDNIVRYANDIGKITVKLNNPFKHKDIAKKENK